MSVNLPQGQGFFLPEVPENIRSTDPAVYQYLIDLRRNITKVLTALVDNDRTSVTAINSGTSGTFVTSGKSFVFVNGILTSTV